MTRKIPKKRPLRDLQESARVATQIALASHPRIPASVALTLGTRWDADSVVFELYVAQDKPQDAIVLTEARVNVFDGRVESMHVYADAVAALANNLPTA